MKRGPKPGSPAALANGQRLKAAWADPAVRAKMSAASKAAWADKAVPHEQKKFYAKLRRNGFSRREALHECKVGVFEAA